MEILFSQSLRKNNGITCHHCHSADCHLPLANVVEMQPKWLLWIDDIVCWQRFEIRSDNWSVDAKFWHAVAQLSECRKRHWFYSQKKKHFSCQWRVEVVAGAVGPADPGPCSSNRVSWKDAVNAVDIKEIQSVNDTLILTMIYTRFVCVLTRNRSCAYNRPHQLLAFPGIASRVHALDPNAPSGSTRRKFGNSIDLPGGIKQQTFYFCALHSFYNRWWIWFVMGAQGTSTQCNTRPFLPEFIPYR